MYSFFTPIFLALNNYNIKTFNVCTFAFYVTILTEQNAFSYSAEMSSNSHTVLLNTGGHMPLLGLGTYRLLSPDVHQAVDAALAAGYRAFDTAAVYHNEFDLGQALKKLLPKYGLTREDVFITR